MPTAAWIRASRHSMAATGGASARDPGRVRTLHRLAAAWLARELGAYLFLILTDVDAVYTGWGTEQQLAIRSMTVAEADLVFAAKLPAISDEE